MLPERLVSIALAAIIAIAVGGGSGSSQVAYPTITQVVTPSATPAPPEWELTPITALTVEVEDELDSPQVMAIPVATEEFIYEPLPVATTTTLAEVVEAEAEPSPSEPAVKREALCPEWWPTALEVGWTEDQLPTLDRIMWNESRCQPDAISPTRDFGLVQINRHVWRETVEANGWTMEDLLIPRNGLAMGLIVYEAALSHGWCGWQPWYRSGQYCR